MGNRLLHFTVALEDIPKRNRKKRCFLFLIVRIVILGALAGCVIIPTGAANGSGGYTGCTATANNQPLCDLTRAITGAGCNVEPGTKIRWLEGETEGLVYNGTANPAMRQIWVGAGDCGGRLSAWVKIGGRLPARRHLPPTRGVTRHNR